MPKERFQWEPRDWSDYLGNERKFIGGDHIGIEHRRLGRIWIHREGGQGMIQVKKRVNREEKRGSNTHESYTTQVK